jgi:hypothetical protein
MTTRELANRLRSMLLRTSLYEPSEHVASGGGHVLFADSVTTAEPQSGVNYRAEFVLRLTNPTGNTEGHEYRVIVERIR